MDEPDGYTGPARLAIRELEFEVHVALRGYFDAIDGRYHWRGRVGASDELTAALGGRAASATLTTGQGSADCSLSEPDPWGRYRVSGLSTPPFRTAITARAWTPDETRS